ncbi:hypothetical protein IE53DRAFT_369505 [Violaceomyces palustris]|uniref:Uncharacterized protein n=1 Tax=Violaceomyces palustris TaxID=1673888 RepID=A0ACD0NVA4_9BASI|nr:hypothetical protein IE53DRAFT_369505 [Violaceomyces palustris]
MSLAEAGGEGALERYRTMPHLRSEAVRTPPMPSRGYDLDPNRISNALQELEDSCSRSKVETKQNVDLGAEETRSIIEAEQRAAKEMLREPRKIKGDTVSESSRPTSAQRSEDTNHEISPAASISSDLTSNAESKCFPLQGAYYQSHTFENMFPPFPRSTVRGFFADRLRVEGKPVATVTQQLSVQGLGGLPPPQAIHQRNPLAQQESLEFSSHYNVNACAEEIHEEQAKSGNLSIANVGSKAHFNALSNGHVSLPPLNSFQQPQRGHFQALLAGCHHRGSSLSLGNQYLAPGSSSSPRSSLGDGHVDENQVNLNGPSSIQQPFPRQRSFTAMQSNHLQQQIPNSGFITSTWLTGSDSRFGAHQRSASYPNGGGSTADCVNLREVCSLPVSSTSSQEVENIFSRRNVSIRGPEFGQCESSSSSSNTNLITSHSSGSLQTFSHTKDDNGVDHFSSCNSDSSLPANLACFATLLGRPFPSDFSPNSGSGNSQMLGVIVGEGPGLFQRETNADLGKWRTHGDREFMHGAMQGQTPTEAWRRDCSSNEGQGPSGAAIRFGSGSCDHGKSRVHSSSQLIQHAQGTLSLRPAPTHLNTHRGTNEHGPRLSASLYRDIQARRLVLDLHFMQYVPLYHQ